ncbi:MAG: Membrane-bound lytic murein transglycosylase A precursor [Candidatus Accumulibacter appositus]|uniref:peptidoglycan lytic exotransglycosylase n=1 Tax=Candidatus Accumulibacter appositus TaxID=1454003 RepID=A0A011P5X9_9PROT|nr:MAG: Membrane-bound lytic murein transglycosylase A precursor [Candidatus Accumulibacter appositus]
MPESQSRTPQRVRTVRALAATFLALLLTACGTRTEAPKGDCPVCPSCPVCEPGATGEPSEPPKPAKPPIPAYKPLQPARWSDLPAWSDDDLRAALPAFLQSCRAFAKRPQWPLWRTACEQAQALQSPSSAAIRSLFEARLQPWLLTNPDGSSDGLVTGYYEPLLRGSRSRGKPYLEAVLGVPPDLLRIDLGAVQPELKNLRLRGRLEGNKVVPYYSRAEITKDDPPKGGRVLLWVDDPVELFFLQIQGSGRVRLPDGSMTRLAFADQNGHPYQSIGKLLVERGEMSLDQASMQGIKQWARANPTRLSELLNANPRYVFFSEQAIKGGDSEGPNGALAVPLTAERSIAVDPRHVPLGAPVFLSTTRPLTNTPLQRLMLAQDTGSAIRGVVRADFFWGFGEQAGTEAGRMKQQGKMWVLLPPGAAPE